MDKRLFLMGLSARGIFGDMGGGSDYYPQLFNDTPDGGTTYLRKVVRMQGTDEVYAVDLRLTDPPGFAGVEDTDFELIYGVIIN